MALHSAIKGKLLSVIGDEVSSNNYEFGSVYLISEYLLFHSRILALASYSVESAK